MINATDRWRDQQLHSFSNATNPILPQEKILLDFVKNYPDVVWQWMAPDSNFKQICANHVVLSDHNATGIIMFGPVLNYQTTTQLVKKILQNIADKQCAYLAINRYAIAQHDLPFELPDSIADSIDAIMNFCNPKIQRLHTFDHVDGDHMVFAHPMDCYGYTSN